MATLAGETRPMLTFGVERGDVHAANLVFDYGFGQFDVLYHDACYAHVKLSVPAFTT